MKDLPSAQRCLRSGFCCKKAPCAYGARDPKTGWCVHLEDAGALEDAVLYRCAIYTDIKRQPGWEFSPAFGGGCSSALFNEDRERIIRALGRL